MRFNAGSNVVCIQQKRKRTNRQQNSSAINEKNVPSRLNVTLSLLNFLKHAAELHQIHNKLDMMNVARLNKRATGTRVLDTLSR